jgi:MraZ protein
MFRGINAVNLDVKGRFAMPTRYREGLHQQSKGELIFTIDTEEKCLLLYPLPVWEGIEAKVSALPSFQPQSRRIQRLLIGHATEAVLDANGRLLLPPVLREYANIDKHVVLLGQGNKFEVWDASSWESRRETWLNDPTEETLPEDLQSLSL